MRKSFVLIILVFLADSFVSISAKEASLNFLNKESVLGVFWGPENRIFGWYLEFKDDGIFSENYDGEGCGGYTGSYKIAGDQLFLNAEEVPCHPENFQSKRTCKVKPLNDSLRYKAKLSCSNGGDYYGGFALPGSTPRKIENSDVLTIPSEIKYLSKPSRIRILPNSKSPFLTCETYAADQLIRDDHLPVKTKLVVIAKLNLKKVQDSSENWYYADIPMDWDGGCKFQGKLYTTGWFPGSVLASGE